MASAQPAGVRFAAQNQEIAPDHSLEDIQMSNERDGDDSNPNTEQDIAQLKSTLQNNIQNSRMQHHAFEPVSLPGSMPASRVRNSNTRLHLASANLQLRFLQALPLPRASQHRAGDICTLAPPKHLPDHLLPPPPFTLLHLPRPPPRVVTANLSSTSNNHNLHGRSPIS
jgi:hypothetical protein